MKIEKTKLDDALIFTPEIHSDERGYFLETFRLSTFRKIHSNSINFVQDNQSFSSYGILRGLHFQKKFPQGKLIRVTQGEVFDVAVDLRKDSHTFLKWDSVTLSETNKKQFWIPPGFAHGFLVLSKNANLEYKCTDYYHSEDEECLIWNDRDINIEWPIDNEDIVLSSKDKSGNSLKYILDN